MISLLINLDRSPERLAFFSAQAQRCGLVFERLSAVDGKRLSEADKAAAVATRFEFQPVNAGEIGLFMSHRACWQRIVESGEAFGAVFEDDAVLSMGIVEVLDGIDAQAPAADVLKLETTGRTVVLQSQRWTLSPQHQAGRLMTWHGGTAAYVVSRQGATRLLAATQPLADPVDQVMFNPMSRVSSSLTVLQVLPAVAMQKNILEAQAEGSVFNTTLDRQHSGGKLFRHGLWIDLRRAWLKARERSRRNRLARAPGHELLRVPFARPDAQ